MRILGLDPGLNHTGWGVIDIEAGHYRHVDSGVIHVPAGELSVRLGHIVRELTQIIVKNHPDCASAEKVFVNLNAQSTLRLSQARAAALIAADLQGLNVNEYTPSEIKLAVTGVGKADKLMVQKMVCLLLNLPEPLQADQADALSCAICCANRLQMQTYEKQGETNRVYALARHGRSRSGDRKAWEALLAKKE